MRIPDEALITDIAVLNPQRSGAELTSAGYAAAYVIFRNPHGEWFALPPADLYDRLHAWRNQGGMELSLEEFQQQFPQALQLAKLDTTPYEFDPDDPPQALLDLNPDTRLIVLDGDQPIGLLLGAAVGRGGRTTSFFVEDGGNFSMAEPSMVMDEPAAGFAPDEAMADTEPSIQPGTLSIEKSEAVTGDDGEKTIGTRYINVEVRDRQHQSFDASTTPLKVDETYYLIFDVDEIRRSATAAGARLVEQNLFDPGVDEIELTIRLASEDFKIRPAEKTLYLPRKGRSINQADFVIQPLHEGSCILSAVFLKGDDFIQVMTIRFHAGPLFSASTLGGDLNKVLVTPTPRDLNLVITETMGGYQLILTGAVASSAHLPINAAYLASMIQGARKALQDVVHTQTGNTKPYQAGIDIPEAVHKAALKQLAMAGYQLYEKLFYGPAMDAQANKLGDRLRQLARSTSLKIRIFSQQFVLPWGMLFVGDDPDYPDAEDFLGFRHIVEHIPLQPDMSVLDANIDSCDGVQIGLHVNTDIDTQMGTPLVASQLQYWQEKLNGGGIGIEVRRSGDDVLAALKNENNNDEILYFYCHAISRDLSEAGGPDASTLVFANNQKLTLEELRLNQRRMLRKAPLVFINACESAELSPLFYDGFVPYFMAKGARGVIGTECETPALFAVEFARRFFERFLKGESLGPLCLDLRRQFLNDHRNILGLLYALYIDGDTRIACEPAPETPASAGGN